VTGGGWFEEAIHAHATQKLEITEILYSSDTELQKIVIFENPTFGRVMTLDDVVQVTEGDEFIYHEMMAHVPILAHGAVRDVLIVGGGDGGLLEEVLKHPVERATMVEIDRSVVDLARRYLPSICKGAFDDPRAELVIADGAHFVAGTDARYDVVLIDSTDPVGPGEILFQREFYAGCKRCLKPGGILVTQNGVAFVQGEELTSSWRHFNALFADAAAYAVAVPTYIWGFMALGWASDDPAHRRRPLATIEKRHAAAGLDTRYYNPEIHLGAFALPTYMKELMR